MSERNTSERLPSQDTPTFYSSWAIGRPTQIPSGTQPSLPLIASHCPPGLSGAEERQGNTREKEKRRKTATKPPPPPPPLVLRWKPPQRSPGMAQGAEERSDHPELGQSGARREGDFLHLLAAHRTLTLCWCWQVNRRPRKTNQRLNTRALSLISGALVCCQRGHQDGAQANIQSSLLRRAPSGSVAYVDRLFLSAGGRVAKILRKDGRSNTHDNLVMPHFPLCSSLNSERTQRGGEGEIGVS